jgi:hypothetical protein
MKKQDLSKAGHHEIHRETIAKFEFFDSCVGFNPYSRYLDVDKVDLILRKKIDDKIIYIEVQVKYGRLYKWTEKFQTDKFDYTSWRFFKIDEFSNAHNKLFIAYVLSHPEGYKGDIFVIPAKLFNQLINMSIPSNTKKGPKRKMYIAHSKKDNKWYLLKKWKFEDINSDTVFDVTEYRRNFEQFKSFENNIG